MRSILIPGDVLTDRKIRVPSDDEEWGDRQEDHWRILFSENVERILGANAVDDVVPAFDPDGEYSGEENIEWTQNAMERLLDIDPEDRVDILTGCAHQIPDEYLEDLREVWERTHDLDELHAYWKDRFLRNLDRWFGDLSPEQIEFIRENDWGEAGRREGNVILATKMPARAREYFESNDAVERRYLYCHCPRIRAAVRRGKNEVLATFCYCGGGFYRSNWERVIGRSVRIELVSSVLGGDDVCRFRITIPEDP